LFSLWLAVEFSVSIFQRGITINLIKNLFLVGILTFWKIDTNGRIGTTTNNMKNDPDIAIGLFTISPYLWCYYKKSPNNNNYVN